MSLWLSAIPSWLSFLVIFTLANGIAVAAMVVARRWYAARGVTAGTPVISSWATGVGGLCALLFAFTIVTLWNNSARAYSNVDDEAGAIRLAARDLARSQLPLLRNYVDLAIAEWPSLCGGKEDARTSAALLTLERLAKPRSEGYAIDLYVQLGTLEDMRNRRWQTSTQSVPDELWLALIVLSVALVIVLAIALPDRWETHLVLTITVATAIGAVFWVATILEYPFCGTRAIGPGEIVAIARSHLI